MQNIIIGTAGHIDHGKTSLIKAMTGRETDRLKQEKERGISIDLGFTYFDLPSGIRAGIVDVPGHEKFIKNMLAGVGGIDIVLLVVAADEGIMPQTREHLNILNLLEAKTGIIALTKSDMVDQEWLEMMTQEVKEGVRETFLKEASIIPISSTKHTGIEELVQEIDKLTKQVEGRDVSQPFRLPIDRVFTIKGFGTVVTGTLVEGQLQVEDTAMVYPNQREVKIRSIQVHNHTVDQAQAGQRVAINISGVKKNQVSRGHVLAAPDSLEATKRMDCKISLLADSPFSLANRDRVHIYHGTSERLGRIILLDQEELEAGQEGYGQILLEEETMVKAKDHLIIRFYSPMVTIGGALVLHTHAPKRKRYKQEVLEELRVKEAGHPKDILAQFLKNQGLDLMTIEEIHKKTGLALGDIEENYKTLLEEKTLVHLDINGEVYLIDKETVLQITKDIKDYLQIFHKANPLKAGISKQEIRGKFITEMKTNRAEQLLRFIEKTGAIKIKEETIALGDFTVKLTPEQKKISQAIENTFMQGAFNPPRFEDVAPTQVKQKKQYQQVFESLIDEGVLIKTSEGIYFHKQGYYDAVEKLQQYFYSNSDINIAQFRDLLVTSRRFAIALLESFDQRKITKRKGDIRILY